MAAYGEFTPTEDQKALGRAAAEQMQAMKSAVDGCRFVLPTQLQMPARYDRKTEKGVAAAMNTPIEIGRCWIVAGPLIRQLGFDWMLQVETKTENFLVRKGRFFMVLKTPSDSDSVGQSDGRSALDLPRA